ncbi:MAG: hypothetical protein LC624_06825 [Halobacteriales archaeon]|nr:hypothetical protein [Halobacteriales archaeon]
MAATLKVDDATKQLLDRLQASLTLAAGSKPSMQELVALLARMGWERRGELLGTLAGWKPADEEELALHDRRLRELAPTYDSSRPMGRDDEDLYGEGA